MPIKGFESDSNLIGYCELHCRTQRALFNGMQVKEMCRLAGEELPDFEDDDWVSMHEEMSRLCKKANALLSKKRVK